MKVVVVVLVLVVVVVDVVVLVVVVVDVVVLVVVEVVVVVVDVVVLVVVEVVVVVVVVDVVVLVVVEVVVVVVDVVVVVVSALRVQDQHLWNMLDKVKMRCSAAPVFPLLAPNTRTQRRRENKILASAFNKSYRAPRRSGMRSPWSLRKLGYVSNTHTHTYIDAPATVFSYADQPGTSRGLRARGRASSAQPSALHRLLLGGWEGSMRT